MTLTLTLSTSHPLTHHTPNSPSHPPSLSLRTLALSPSQPLQYLTPSLLHLLTLTLSLSHSPTLSLSESCSLSPLRHSLSQPLALSLSPSCSLSLLYLSLSHSLTLSPSHSRPLVLSGSFRLTLSRPLTLRFTQSTHCTHPIPTFPNPNRTYSNATPSLHSNMAHPLQFTV